MTVSLKDMQMTSVPGVYAKEGVVLNPRMRGFLVALRLKFGSTIAVNSGERSTHLQASAMYTKVMLAADGAAELRKIYRGSLIEEIIQGGIGSLEAIKRTLDDQVARGVFISDHMRADALDLRVLGLSDAEDKKLKADVESLGAKALRESTPPHLHLEDIPMAYAAGDPMVLGGAALAATFLWWLYSD